MSTILTFKSFRAVLLLSSFYNFIKFYQHFCLICNFAKKLCYSCAIFSSSSILDNLHVSLQKKILGKLSSHLKSSIIENNSYPLWTKLLLCKNFTSWELFGFSNFCNNMSIDVTTSLRFFSGHKANKLIMLSPLFSFPLYSQIYFFFSLSSLLSFFWHNLLVFDFLSYSSLLTFSGHNLLEYAFLSESSLLTFFGQHSLLVFFFLSSPS